MKESIYWVDKDVFENFCNAGALFGPSDRASDLLLYLYRMLRDGKKKESLRLVSDATDKQADILTDE